jgi:hypothetical protein
MSADGYLNGTRRWPLFIALELPPIPAVHLKKPPHLLFPLAPKGAPEHIRGVPNNQNPTGPFGGFVPPLEHLEDDAPLSSTSN